MVLGHLPCLLGLDVISKVLHKRDDVIRCSVGGFRVDHVFQEGSKSKACLGLFMSKKMDGDGIVEAVSIPCGFLA